MIAAPMFHSWGFVHFTLGMSLSSTLVLNRKFDPEATLSLTAQHECDGADRRAGDDAADPRAARRVLKRYDLSKLRVVAVSGSALPGELSDRWMDLFGENVYNLYGSTEVAWASIATPEDLRAAPGDRRPRAARHDRQALRRRRQAGRPGRDRPHLRRQRDAVRGLHGRRQQGRRSTGCSRPATSATSTRRAACSSTAATTT